MASVLAPRLFVTLAALAFATSSASAQTLQKTAGFPERNISIIVPYGPGGGSDQVARAWGTAMQKVTGVAYQVENKDGGGGLAALPDFLARPKDGYTLLQHTDALASAEAAKQIDFKLGVEVLPLCITQATFSQLYIRPSETRFKDWASLLAYAKAKPGEVSLANIGVEGSMEVVQVQALEEAAGIKLKQISFDKPSERYAALLGGHTDVLFEQPGDVIKFLEAGQMKPVLSLLPDRPDAYKDVAALKDSGLGSVQSLQRIRAFWIHKDVPADRRAYLEKACEIAYNSPEFQTFNTQQLMHLSRSYYNASDSIPLLKNMIATYQKYMK
ncbi:MAG: tripartite tricarboxylate transporter substrate binding protein [Alphaproteobacteria bacterium]|nr:tripartite tricarboxylate transporter substrate binding protein [Alphaproteobacteria bacterium]